MDDLRTKQGRFIASILIEIPVIRGNFFSPHRGDLYANQNTYVRIEAIKSPAFIENT